MSAFKRVNYINLLTGFNRFAGSTLPSVSTPVIYDSARQSVIDVRVSLYFNFFHAASLAEDLLYNNIIDITTFTLAMTIIYVLTGIY